jgi:hypothetical protein
VVNKIRGTFKSVAVKAPGFVTSGPAPLATYARRVGYLRHG